MSVMSRNIYCATIIKKVHNDSFCHSYYSYLLDNHALTFENTHHSCLQAVFCVNHAELLEPRFSPFFNLLLLAVWQIGINKSKMISY